MTDYPLRAAALDDEGCAAVHAATIELLEHTGVEVHHDEALALLQKAGARVDGTRARIPRALVDDALFAAPRSIPLTSRSDAPGITLESGPVYYGTGSDCLYMLGPGARERRPVNLADVEDMAALQEKLPAIDFVMSMAHPHELDADVRPGRPVRRHAARHVQTADHGAGGRHRRRAVQGDGRRLRRRRQLGRLRDAHAAARARPSLGRAARSAAPSSTSRWSTPARICRAPRRPPRAPAACCSPTPRC